jgi:hypothetical protein
MKIKNYTSEVPANKSIQRIEQRLVQQGARNVWKEYDEKGRMSGLSFTIPKEGRLLPFKLPARVENVVSYFLKKHPYTSEKKIREQTERTAWRMMDEWTDLQMSLIAIDQAEFMEIFLPYIYDAHQGKTHFEIMRDNGFNLLPEKT